ncbi:ribonuclease HII [Spirobacillus cienkowskii]
MQSYFPNEFFLLNLLSTHHHISKKIIIAIDEVGRGCVAGPVLCCASLWISATEVPFQTQQQQTWLPLIDDSKKLTEKKRNQCFAAILASYQSKPDTFSTSTTHFIPNNPSSLNSSQTQIHWNAAKFLELKQHSQFITEKEMMCVHFALGESSAEEVDSYNIWQAVQLAAARALNLLCQLFKNQSNLTLNFLNDAIILMDGKHFLNVPKDFINIPQITITQADSVFKSVGFSSVIAKVSRDNFMISQDKEYPLFGFSKHKGYGTAKHLSLIKDAGSCPLHRKSFLTNCQKTTLF